MNAVVLRSGELRELRISPVPSLQTNRTEGPDRSWSSVEGGAERETSEERSRHRQIERERERER